MLLSSSQSPELKSAGGGQGRADLGDKRSKYLERVIQQIEEGRIIKAFRYHYSAKGIETSASPTFRRSVSVRARSMDNADLRHSSNSLVDRLSKSTGSPPQSLSPDNRLKNLVRSDMNVMSKGKLWYQRTKSVQNGKDDSKLPNISVTTPHNEDRLTPTSKARNAKYSLQNLSPRDDRTKSKNTTVTFDPNRSRPPSDQSNSDKSSTDTNHSRLGKVVDEVTAVKRFHQKAHQYKRMKTYHELLIERRLLRKRGIRERMHNLFRPKEPEKMTAGARIRKVLKRAQYYGDDIKRLPLVRFRRAARTLIALLKTVKLSRDKGKGQEPTMWIDEDDIRASRRAYEMFGLTFDPFLFRVNRDLQVSNEAKAILSMTPGTRSEEQQHVALVSLCQAVPAFSEFPKAMQKSLVRVGWYETFEPRRIIIREGHMADNFYLILSGTAVVTIRELNKQTGEYFGRMAAVLKKGMSFGELALMYGGKRSATVTCKDNVELLAVGRDDYIDIFMQSEQGREPEHVSFLRSVKLLADWPVSSLPLDDPSVCLYTYVRRGVLLCKDSNKSDWIYVIKSGSCRVLKALTAVKPTIHWTENPWDHSKDVVPNSPPQHKITDPRLMSPPCTRRSGRLSPLNSRSSTRSDTPRRSNPFSDFKKRTDEEVQEAAMKHIQQLDDILKRQHFQTALVTEISKDDSPKVKGKHRNKNERVFVQVVTLGPKDVFGLESILLSVYQQPTSTSLVSDGAECILINRKFFKQHLTEDVAKKIRREIRPLPSEETLQEKLQTKTDWEAYRAITVTDMVEFRKHLQDNLLY